MTGIPPSETGASVGEATVLGAPPPVTWTITRDQLIDALANIEIRNIATSGPMAGKCVADDMADAILAQMPCPFCHDEGDCLECDPEVARK